MDNTDNSRYCPPLYLFLFFSPVSQSSQSENWVLLSPLRIFLIFLLCNASWYPMRFYSAGSSKLFPFSFFLAVYNITVLVFLPLLIIIEGVICIPIPALYCFSPHFRIYYFFYPFSYYALSLPSSERASGQAKGFIHGLVGQDRSGPVGKGVSHGYTGRIGWVCYYYI